MSGELVDGSVLPSERELSKILGVHRNTIIKAYYALKDMDLIESAQGVGYRVSYGTKDDLGFMYPGIHNYSEIGKLNKVLLHRIGSEVEGLVPDNFARLLFDDIPYLKVAQEEHDRFAQLLRNNGVEVVYYVDETAKALADEKVKEAFVNDILDESDLLSEGIREAIYNYLIAMPAKAMVEKVIAGVKKTDIPKIESRSLADFITSAYPFYMLSSKYHLMDTVIPCSSWS